MQAQAIRSVRLIGKRPTLDLRVDHGDHNFYAEGVVVSNSHAVEYACLTAATIYLKAKAPQAFYLSMLKLAGEEPDAIAYMNGIISEMRATGIQLLPPDLLKSEAGFTIQDGHIRFGLSSIKGISAVTMTKVASFKRDFTGKFDIFEAAKTAKLDIRTLSSLIMCGCLDSILKGSSRAKLALEAQLYGLLTPNEKLLAKRYAVEFNEDLLALVKGVATKVNEKGKPLVRASRLDTLRKDYADHWAAYQANEKNEELCMYLSERALLGWSYTSSLWQCFTRKVVGLTPIKNIQRFKGTKEHLKIVAFIEEAKTKISAKGVPYLMVNVYDDDTSTRCLLHGQERIDSCQGYNGALPRANDMVTISGQLSEDGGLIFAESIIVQISPLRRAKGEVEI